MPRNALLIALLTLLGAISALGQSYAPMPAIRYCPLDASGNPLPAGKVFAYQFNSSNPQDTWTDGTGGSKNTNPVILDAGGCAQIWVNNLSYKFLVQDSAGAQQFVVDLVQEPGLSALNKAVLLAPAAAANQTIVGPITAYYFTGSAAHTTSPGVRVALLASTTALDTAANPPNMVTTQPAVAGQAYTIPDPGTATANFVLSPGTTANTLDCTKVGLACIRTAYAYFEGAGCNSTTAGLGWDNFTTNTPVPLCITGTNIQKGVMALPSAATKLQEQTASGACAATCTLTYPAATAAGDFLVAVIAADTSRTVASLTDGTNAYTKAIGKTSGTGDCEIWYFNGNSTAMAASSTLTLTLSGNGNAAWTWFSYKDILTAAALDATASNSGTGTAVTTGTTAGTAQNTELILSAACALTNPTVTPGSGTTGHTTVSQGANITENSSGRIQQAAGAQSDSFTLGSSQTWASVIATFKANVGGAVKAQRHIRLPASYLSASPVSAFINWQAPAAPTGTVNVRLGASVVCTAPGSTDDPAMLAATASSVAVNTSAANIVTDTSLTPLTTTGCAAGNVMHFQVERDRYNAADIYEGYAYVNGVGLSFGSQ